MLHALKNFFIFKSFTYYKKITYVYQYIYIYIYVCVCVCVKYVS